MRRTYLQHVLIPAIAPTALAALAAQVARAALVALTTLTALTAFALPVGAWHQNSGFFIENRGQWPDAVRFGSAGPGMTVFLTSHDVIVDLHSECRSVWVRWDPPETASHLEGRGQRPSKLRFFLGADESRWCSDVSAYSEVVYHDVRPGIDLHWRWNDGVLEYQCRRPDDVAGAGGVAYGPWTAVWEEPPEAAGFLRLEGAASPAASSAPSSAVSSEAGLHPDGAPSSATSSAPSSAPSPAAGPNHGVRSGTDEDPATLNWCTVFGGGDNEYAHGVTYTPDGSILLAGYSRSTNLPTSPGAYDPSNNGGYDIYIASFDLTGSVLHWVTYMGGSEEDRPFGIVTDDYGRIFFTGQTYSPNFPTTPGAFDRTLGGIRDAYVACMNADGTELLWCTYLGGEGQERAWEICLDQQRRPIVTGETQSEDYPVTPGAYDTIRDGSSDAFVTKVDVMGTQLVWSTLLGGVYQDYAMSMTLDELDRPVLIGSTTSSDFPTSAGAYDETFNGSADCFVARLDALGQELLHSTFLGGSFLEIPADVELHPGGDLYVTGATLSPDFPTNGVGFDLEHGGGKDAFIARLDGACTELRWSSFLGGNQDDETFTMTVDGTGSPIVSGEVNSFDFPVTVDAFDRSYNGATDAFLARVHASGSHLTYCTYFGGDDLDGGWDLVMSPDGEPLLVGPSRSTDFPTTAGAYDMTNNGGKDAFMALFDIVQTSGVEDEPVVGDEPVGGDARRGWVPIRVVPNPARDRVTLGWHLAAPGQVTLAVFDASGRRVAELLSGFLPAGDHQWTWDGRGGIGPAGATTTMGATGATGTTATTGATGTMAATGGGAGTGEPRLEPGAYWIRLSGSGAEPVRGAGRVILLP